jgi:hypothetical protein
VTGANVVLWLNLFALAFSIFVLVDALLRAFDGEEYGWRFAGAATAVYLMNCTSLIIFLR